MTKIDPYSLTTVPIEQLANGNPMKSATGFIWKHGNQHCLVTNWHVVTGKHAHTFELTTESQPDELRVMFNLRGQNFGKQDYKIRIRDDQFRPLWFAHPVRGRLCDVVAVPLPLSGFEPSTNLYPINVLRSEDDLAVGIGMDVFILGYPFGPTPPGFPVWKRGSIASEPDLTPIGTGYLLVDTASRPGMSGAPAVLRSWAVHVLSNGGVSMRPEPANKFIGVYSGRLHTKNTEDAQLGIVWPKEDIEEIIVAAKLDTST